MDHSEIRFDCPVCRAPLFGEKMDFERFNESPKKTITAWSDGKIEHSFVNMVGSIASCPLCWAVFPNYWVPLLAQAPEPVQLGEGIGVVRDVDNSELPIDPERRVVSPTFKTWRLVKSGYLTDDPVLMALSLESYVQANNDRLRKKALKGHLAESVFDTAGVPQSMVAFVASVKNGKLNSHSASSLFNSTLGEFFGMYRLYFLCIEVARYMRKWEWCFQFLQMLRDLRATSEDYDDDLWELTGEMEYLPFPGGIWGTALMPIRLRTIEDAVNKRNKLLVTIVNKTFLDSLEVNLEEKEIN